MIDPNRLANAYLRARADLLAERTENMCWVGELSTSALSTATAVSVFSLVRSHEKVCDKKQDELVVRGVQWLVAHQNVDGGWGDTDKSYSNIATTMLVVAAIRLSGDASRFPDTIGRANQYTEQCGGVDALRARYGVDKTFVVPILTNCALAGMVSWEQVSALPFELACLPQSIYRFLGFPVVSYAIPALVAVGQARFFHRPPDNPLVRGLRRLAVEPSLRVLARMQPRSGGFLEAVPLTSFVAMCLIAIGRIDHPVSRAALRFLIHSVRSDASWPIDTNLATWTTTLAINALSHVDGELDHLANLKSSPHPVFIDWILSCQHRERHPFTGATPGGWGWTDLSGAVPDADDTAGALLALANCRVGLVAKLEESRPTSEGWILPDRIDEAAQFGVDWLLNLQNTDGGWPTFCRGWGKLPFDRSGSDLTAHAIRALFAWRCLGNPTRIDRAIELGFDYLEKNQQADGSWLPLWFGNQNYPQEANPVYGTSKALIAYQELNRFSLSAARRGVQWLVLNQNQDGGWGDCRGIIGGRPTLAKNPVSSVEETALALESLLPLKNNSLLQTTIKKGLVCLTEIVQKNDHQRSSPIGFYFAKLWYYERLYPTIYTVSALGRALSELGVPLRTLPIGNANKKTLS